MPDPTTPLLEIPEMVQAQQNPYVIFNQAVRILEKAAGVGLTKIIDVSASNHNIVESNWGAYIRMTSGTAQTVTVPENATLGVVAGGPLHFAVHFRGAGAGGVTFVEESTNVIIHAATLELGVNVTATLINVAEDEWDLIIGAPEATP